MSAGSFAGSILRRLTRILSCALTGEETARRSGLMQGLDPRVRLLAIAALLLAVALVHKLTVLMFLLFGAAVLAVASAVSVRTLVLRAWLPVLAFTGVIALPALFLTPGSSVQAGSPITWQGLYSAAMLVLRVETAVTLTTVLVLTSAWTRLLKALRLLHLPKEAVMMLGMAHRYIFLLAETAMQMFESRESRRVGVLRGPEQRKLVAQTSGVLMSKSLDLSQEVFLAMQARGYRGEVYVSSSLSLRAADYAALFVFMAVAALAIWWGR